LQDSLEKERKGLERSSEDSLLERQSSSIRRNAMTSVQASQRLASLASRWGLGLNKGAALPLGLQGFSTSQGVQWRSQRRHDHALMMLLVGPRRARSAARCSIEGPWRAPMSAHAHHRIIGPVSGLLMRCVAPPHSSPAPPQTTALSRARLSDLTMLRTITSPHR
jgi:hypothetical protein